MTGTTRPDQWTPAVGDLVADRRPGSTARIAAIGNRPARVHHDNPTVTLEWTHRAGWSRRSMTRMLPLRRTYQPAAPPPEETPVTVQPADTRPGLNAAHLPFIARLIAVADQAGVTVTYYCYNADWSIMTSPPLDDEAGAAFLEALDVGEVGGPEQKSSRTIFAGPQFAGGVRLFVRSLPADDAEETP